MLLNIYNYLDKSYLGFFYIYSLTEKMFGNSKLLVFLLSSNFVV